METAPFRETLRRPPSTRGQTGPGLRAWVRQKLDIAQYRPLAVQGVVESRLEGRDGVYYILKNPEEKTYYRLSDHDYFLWHHMDGTRTVKDLVVAYFLAYGSFAFSRVATLIDGLKAKLFLEDQPVRVYRQVKDQLDRRDLAHRLNAIWQGFLQLEFAFRGLDRVVAAVYRLGGWLLFTRPALALYIIVSIGGLVLFGRVVSRGGYGVVTIGGSYVWGIIGLVSANLVSIFVHEMAHALTVKHYGREVRRGGFLIFFGMPAFFVDTMDIWLEGKRARLAVTWAGPYSGLILGGLASAVMAFWPAFPINALLFQFAFLSYITTFFNLNPLLELDGYFLLMDWLEIPMLRQRSLAFIRTGVWAKLNTFLEKGEGLRRALRAFSREERIFSVFGILSAIWTGYAIFSAAQFWRAQLASAVQNLWAQGGDVGKIALAAVGLAVSAPFVVALGLSLLGSVRSLLTWLVRSILAASTWVGAAVLFVAAVAVALLPGYLGHPVWLKYVAMASLAGACFFSWRNAVRSSGSRFSSVWWLLGAHAFLLLARDFSLAVALSSPGRPALNLIAAIMGHVAYLSLFAAGLRAFARIDLGQLHLVEKGLLVAGITASFALAAWVAAGAGESIRAGDLQALLAVSSTVIPLAAATLLVPTATAFLGTRAGPAWLLMLAALCGHITANLLGTGAHFPAQLLLGAFLLNSLAVSRGRPVDVHHEPALDISDENRLRRAFAWTVSTIFGQVRESAGLRSAGRLAERINNHTAAAGWRVSVAHGQVDDALAGSGSMIEHGRIYAAVLTMLLNLTVEELGERMAVRMLQRAYDALPWEEREIASQYLFRGVPRTASLSDEFRETRQSNTWLLRQMALFAAMDESELALVCARLRPERFPPGKVIIRQGDRGDRFYIVGRGHVEVTQRDERGVTDVVNQLDRGDYFGELALLRDAPRNATCRTTVPTELLSLRRADFDTLVKDRFALREKVGQSIARVDLLRRMPLFDELDGRQLGLIGAQLREEAFEAGDVIINEGDVGDTFYVIESGRVLVTATHDGGERIVAERGPGDYVGEIALLLEGRRTATVRAVVETHVLTLEKSDFDRLVADHLYVSRSLERATSRRMLDLQRTMQAA